VENIGVKDSEGGVVADILEQLVNKYLLVTCEGKLSGQDGLIVFKHFIELPDSALENRKEVGETKMSNLMHIRIHIYLERTHCQGNVGSRSRSVNMIVIGLPLKIRSQDSLHQLSTADSHHALIHSELKFPGARF